MTVDAYCSRFLSATELLAHMDAARLDVVVLAAWPRDAQDADGNPLPQNDGVTAAMRFNPDRILGCLYIEALAPDAVQQVTAAAAAGCKAINLFPSDGYGPDDRMLMPLLDEAAKHNLAVFFHTGLPAYRLPSVPGARNAPRSGRAYPMRLDPVCRLYPNTQFLLPHMGYPLMAEAWSICHNASNIYLSLGDAGVRTHAPAQAYCAMGHSAFIPLPTDKLVFGSGSDVNLASARCRFEAAAERLFPPGNSETSLSANATALLHL